MLKSIISFWFLLLLFACSVPQNEKEPVTEPSKTIQDELGRSFPCRQPVRRILPLCASSMETLLEFCDTAQLIGRTPEYQDARFLHKPVVNNYPLDIEHIVALKPDLLVSKEGMLGMDQLHKLETLGIPVYMQKGNSIEDMVQGIERLAELTGHAQKGKQVAEHFRKAFDELKQQAGAHGNAIVYISSEPLYVFGRTSYMTDVLSYCGLQNAVDSSIVSPFPVVDQEYLLAVDPDFLIFPQEQKQSQELFRKYPALKRLKAYRTSQCLYVNGDWLSRPSPYLLDLARSIVKQLPH